MPPMIAAGGVVLALCLGGAPVAGQQGIAVGGGAAIAAPAGRLGGSSLTGWATSIGLPLGEWTSLEASVAFPSPTDVGSPTPRHYATVIPALGIRTELTDGRLPIAITLGAGMWVYRRHGAFDTAGTAPAATNIPGVHVGLGTRLRIWSWLAADLSVRDWLTVERDQQLVRPQGTRGLTQSFDVRLGLVTIFRPRTPALPRPAEVPIAYMAQVYRTAGTGPPVASGDNGAIPATMASVVAIDEITLGAVYFASGSAEIASEYRPLLDQAAQYLRAHPAARLALVGYADSSGSPDPNASLAERRATAIADLLVRLYGVDPRLVSTIALGVDYRATDPSSARRADVRVRIPKQGQP